MVRQLKAKAVQQAAGCRPLMKSAARCAWLAAVKIAQPAGGVSARVHSNEAKAERKAHRALLRDLKR